MIFSWGGRQCEGRIRADDDRLTVLIRLTIRRRYSGGRLVKSAEKRTGTRDNQDDVDRTKRVHDRHDCGGGEFFVV